MSTFTLETTVSHLRAALRTMMPISRHQSIPVLNMLHIKGSKLTGMDLDISVTTTIAATIAQGEALVPYRELRALAANLPLDEVITLSAQDNELKLCFSNGSYQLPTMDPTEFPNFKFDASHSITGIDDKFSKALRYVISSTSYEETRYYLNGIHLSRDENGQSVAVATDGHRLTYHPVGFDIANLDGIIIPNAVVKLINQLPAPESIELSEDYRIAFHYSGICVYAKLIDGTYPDWKKVIKLPENSVLQQITIPRKEFRSAMNRLHSVINEGFYDHTGIYLAAYEGRLHLVNRTEANREYYETIDLSDRAASLDCTMYFQGKYLQQIFAAIHAESLTFTIVDECTPTLITAGEGFQAILMPMRPDSVFAKRLLDRLKTVEIAA